MSACRRIILLRIYKMNYDLGKNVMISAEAYRDEGTSYHYAPAADYITIRNADIVANFMRENGIPFVKGKTWTTDSFYRETINNFNKHKADGLSLIHI